MGVKNLWDILESCKKTLPLHHLQNKRVCIDLSCWIVQLHNVNKSHGAIKDKLYLRGLFHRLRALIALNCSLIFVADGSIPAIKLATYRRRLNSGLESTQDQANSLMVTSLRRNKGSEFSCMIKEAKVLGLALGVPCLDGIEEAEAQCALLNTESMCDGCFTSDSDAFLFGARTVYRDICLGEGGHVVCYEMTDIEKKLGLGRNSLITLALFLGSDYSQGVHGLGMESACHIVKSVGDNNVLQRIASEGMDFVKKMKRSKKQTQNSKCSNEPRPLDSQIDINGIDNNLEGQNQFLQVIDAYLNPKCHSTCSDVVYSVLAPYPFQRDTLQELCVQFFGWPPEHTDEYILPKIAEKNLRRFANLRSTSSELGVRPSLHQIPIKCPVSGIVKRRKVKGTECFEVLWEAIDGLKTSIVPADLVVSACPEKITEFEERIATEKKQNQRKPRPKKKENRYAMAEVDTKLQTLLLDIEAESSSAYNSCFPTKAVILEDRSTKIAAKFISQEPLYAEIQSKIESSSAMSSFCIEPLLIENEVIDLLSPSPPRHPGVASRPELGNDQQVVEVMDLSDSETEMSPEHMRKAKAVILEDRTTKIAAKFISQEPLYTERPSKIECSSTMSSFCIEPLLTGNEVIDLLSPSPPRHSGVASRREQGNDQQVVEVMYLSDSETKMSPEHMRKAKELRSFLASIRNDIS